MPHFFVKKEEISDEFIVLSDSDTLFHLVKVLRTKKGENVKFIDIDKNVYFTSVLEISADTLKAEILKKEKSHRFLKNNVHLIQSILANSDSQNLLIANAVQTGVKEIYPVISDNVSIKKDLAQKKLQKWQKVALENFKQCERADIAKINEISNLKEVLLKFDKKNVIVFAEKYENCDFSQLSEIDKTLPVALVIGPEGGFSEDEFDYFKQNNYKMVSLGKMIYKAPNAVVAGVSNVVSRLEDEN